MEYKRITFLISESELMKLNRMKEVNGQDMSKYMRYLLNSDYNLYISEKDVNYLSFGEKLNQQTEKRIKK